MITFTKTRFLPRHVLFMFCFRCKNFEVLLRVLDEPAVPVRRATLKLLIKLLQVRSANAEIAPPHLHAAKLWRKFILMCSPGTGCM